MLAQRIDRLFATAHPPTFEFAAKLSNRPIVSVEQRLSSGVRRRAPRRRGRCGEIKSLRSESPT